MLNETYNELNNYIYKNIENEETKEKLYRFNKDVFNMFKYNVYFNIYLNYIGDSEEETVKEIVIKILTDYEIFKNITYSLKKIERNNLIILESGNNDFTKEYYRYSYDNVIRDNQEYSILLINSNNYTELRELNRFKDIFFNSQLLKIEKECNFNELKNIYKNNNINLSITNEDYNNIKEMYINNELCDKSDFNNYIYDVSIKNFITKDKEKVDIDCFNKFEIKENNKIIDINEAVGLTNIQTEIKKIVEYVLFLKNNKLPLDNIYLNMIFMGNPGSGKTTVAENFAHLLFENKIIKNDKVVTILPTDLMGKYVGHTGDKCRKIFESVDGGILFIDEAYLLFLNERSNKTTVFMDEALTELLKYMENPNNIVILAGYTKEMKGLYEANPGLKSRIYKELVFNDYTENELLQIIKNNLNKYKFKISKNIDNLILTELKKAKEIEDFGNARFALNYSQKLIMNHTFKKLKNENYLIEKEDIELINVEGGFGFIC